MGFREHAYMDEQCWCMPLVRQQACEGCGELHTLVVHRDVTLTMDNQPRMTVFSR